jgi:2-haloacid dehalogenase
LADSLGHWEPFPDTVEALRALKSRYKLAIISNVDDGLFALTACRLGVEFDWIITAEQVGTYKPSRRNFEVALERMGVPREKLLHAAESLFHDVVPAKELGLSTVWVHRRSGKEGFGATPPADAEPDFVVPDLETLATELGV